MNTKWTGQQVIFMKSLNRNNNTESDQSDHSESDHTNLIKMNSSKRKRATNVLVRSVSSPIKQGYVVIFVCQPYKHDLFVNLFFFLLICKVIRNREGKLCSCIDCYIFGVFCLGPPDRPSHHSSEWNFSRKHLPGQWIDTWTQSI